mgnify:CR=1 FL=1
MAEGFYIFTERKINQKYDIFPLIMLDLVSAYNPLYLEPSKVFGRLDVIEYTQISEFL